MSSSERRKTSSEETQTNSTSLGKDSPSDSYSLAEVKSLIDRMHLKYVTEMQADIGIISDRLHKRVDQCDANMHHFQSTLPTSDAVETVSDKLEGAEQMLEQYRIENRELNTSIKTIEQNVNDDIGTIRSDVLTNIADIQKQYPPLL